MKCSVRGCPNKGSIQIKVEVPHGQKIVVEKKQVCRKCFDLLRPEVQEKRQLSWNEDDGIGGEI